MCEYFLMCTNPADGKVNVPFLGKVPCCNSCAAKLNLEMEKSNG